MTTTELLLRQNEASHAFIYDEDGISTINPQIHAKRVLAKNRFLSDSDKEAILNNEHPQAEQELNFELALDTADRALNGLYFSLLIDNRIPYAQSEFGAFLHKTSENPQLTDHNWEHSRRIELIKEKIIALVPELRTEEVACWLDSGALFDRFHDIDQSLTIQRNLDEGTHLKAKQGHALGAAVMTLAMSNRYAHERNVSPEEAWRICAGAAVMMIRHDEPDNFDTIFAQTTPPYAIESEEMILLSGKKLLEAFHNNTIDIFSLSPSQLIDLLQHEKGLQFMSQKSPFGLHPTFEEEYSNELQDLATNQMPLLDHLSPKDRTALTLLTEVEVRADMIEMIAPPIEALIRTLLTQRSLDRPFYRERDLQELLEKAMQKKGNLDGSIDCDVRRLLWEFWNIGEINPTGPVARNEFVQQLQDENILMGLIALREVGTEIMQGNYDLLSQIYARRQEKLARKAFKKARIPWDDHFATLSFDQIISLLDKNISVADAYKEKVTHLQEDEKQLRIKLEEKRKNTHKEKYGNNESVPTYSEQEIIAFQTAIDTFIQKKFKNTPYLEPSVFDDYREQLILGEYPSTLPYKTYDRLQKLDPKVIRTLIKSLFV